MRIAKSWCPGWPSATFSELWSWQKSSLSVFAANAVVRRVYERIKNSVTNESNDNKHATVQYIGALYNIICGLELCKGTYAIVVCINVYTNSPSLNQWIWHLQGHEAP